MQDVTQTDFAESLAHLRQALADADPLTVAPDGAVSDNAERAAALYTSASDDVRARLLLRALDDAIAAIEIASHLADELHAQRHDVGAEGVTPEHMTEDRGRLYAAYLAFAESQTQYQALYQYRNVLAAQLNEQAHAGPARVSPPTTKAEPAGEKTARPSAPRRIRKKSN